MKRLLPFIILLVLVIGSVVAVPFLLRPERYKTSIEEKLTGLLQHRVIVGKVQAVWWPPTLRLEDVNAMDAAETGALLRVRRIDIQPVTASLLKLQFIPRLITLENPWVQARRRADGSWEWIGSRPKAQPAASGAIPFERLDIHDGEWHVDDPFAGGAAFVVQHVEGRLTPAHLSLQGQLRVGALPLGIQWDSEGNPRERVGQLQLKDETRIMTLHVAGKPGGVDVKGESAEWRTDSLARLLSFACRWPMSSASAAVDVRSPVKEWKASLALSGGRIVFDQSGMLSEGRGELKGELNPAGDHHTLQITGAFQNVPLGDLAGMMGVSLPLEGRFTGVGRFDIAVASSPWRHLQGQVTAEVSEGRCILPDSAVRNLKKARTLQYFKAKFPDFEKTGVPFKVWKAHAEAAQGFVKVDDAFLDAGDLKVAGSVRLDAERGGIDGYVRMQIREKRKELMAKIPSHYIFGPPRHEVVQPIYGHLQGEWNAWTVRAVSSSRVPRDKQDHLRRAIR